MSGGHEDVNTGPHESHVDQEVWWLPLSGGECTAKRRH